jgi:hypothetical protein
MNRLRIQQRTRIYLGCEGPSEQSYGKRLNEIADAAGLSLALDCNILQPGGGDPLALIQLAARRIRQKTGKRGAFAQCAVLLDKDKLGQVRDRDRQISALASKHKLWLIWQNPCHEAFLLRHFPNQATKQPQTSELAGQALKKIWPAYRKGLPASDLAAMIDRNSIERIASVEEDFRVFLQKIGLFQSD